MVSRKDIQATCDDIVREFDPLQVILFGSYAYGTPKEYSDVDLLVVMHVEKMEARRQESEIRERIPERFKMDLRVRSPEEIAFRVSHNDWFLREVTEKGEVLYESDNYIYIPYKKENNRMNPLTLEWVEFAEGDYSVAKENLHGQNPIYHVICFLAQQTTEKYLKAWLQEYNIPIQRTHDLVGLLDSITPTIPKWSVWKTELRKLSEHAVDTRYPSDIKTDKDAARAMTICETVRKEIRTHLKLPIEEEKNP